MSDCNEIGRGRRRFILGVGVALLTVRCLPSIAQASGSSPSDANEAGENLMTRSGPGFATHTHDLLIPYALLNRPPLRGAKLESTTALFHTHKMVLTREQLIIVSRGGTVTAIGGSHSFVIALARAINH